MAASAPLLAVRDLTKTFGGARALDGVTLAFAAGEIHALVGENGAGKSTLIRCCTGVLTPDGGELLLDGAPLRLRSPRQARELGLRVVHQEAEFFPDLSLAENLLHVEGLPVGSVWWLDWRGLRATVREELRTLELDLPVEVPAARLGLGQRLLTPFGLLLPRLGVLRLRGVVLRLRLGIAGRRRLGILLARLRIWRWRWRVLRLRIL